MRPITDSKLFRFIQGLDPELHTRALEIRRAAQAWLEYIPHTFPHYTRHTAQHSDNIVGQLSHLLFHADSEMPTATFNAAEVYVLLASVYLHDAGMVASDAEKARIIQTEEWRNYIAPGSPGYGRWLDIERLRTNEDISAELAAFLADLQLRFLLAEYIRRVHHERVVDFLTEHESQIANFGLGDPSVVRSIAAVCRGHGLSTSQLEDDEAYPERRILLDEHVNVRFLTMLLRLGDLLDLNSDRACPLLLNAAAPLPSDSYAHWSQYQRVVHQLVSPERIEITAECKSQEEHRFLVDWCSWVVREIKTAGWVMARAARHGGWQPPVAEIAAPNPTIAVRPRDDASYIPTEWKLDLDEEAVAARLIHSTYGRPYTFVRELIQNAADASRCQVCRLAVERGGEAPVNPTDADPAMLEELPIEVALHSQQAYNELADTYEDRQVVTVTDRGVGMSIDRITRYFLQIGRSYYRTEDFRRTYPFHPGSRFGIGFLSVFGVSEDVTVETLPADASGASSIRMRLTGLRQYLLTENGDRTTFGTQIHVVLKERVNPSEFVDEVRRLCRNLEFPVRLITPNHSEVIYRECPEDFETEIPDVTTPGARFRIRSFPTAIDGLDGSLFVFEHLGPDGEESWARWHWARYRYPELRPDATVPDMPDELLCLQGLSVLEASSWEPYAARVDVRKEVVGETLSREVESMVRGEIASALLPRWIQLMRDHLNRTPLAASPGGWRYIQQLMDHFRLAGYWRNLDGTIPYWAGHSTHGSIAALERAETIVTAVSSVRLRGRPHFGEEESETETPPAWRDRLPSLTPATVRALSGLARRVLFSNRAVTRLYWLESGHVAAMWGIRLETAWDRAAPDRAPRMDPVALPVEALVGFPLQRVDDSTYERYILNTSNPLVAWCVRMADLAESGQYGLHTDQVRRVYELLVSPVGYGGHHAERLVQYLAGWGELRELPADERPPVRCITGAAFQAAELIGALRPAASAPGSS